MFYISDSQKKVLTVWALIGLIIFLLVVLITIVSPKPKNIKEEEKITANNSNLVINRSRYYTVKNAITKYYSYVNMEDYNSVLNILDKKYKEENNIEINNIKDFLTDTKLDISYQSKVMCLKDMKDGIYTFVIEGEEISANTGVSIKEKYYEITLDGNKTILWLKPIDKAFYKEVCNG